MADINTVYAGVAEYFDPKADSGVPNFNGNIFNPVGNNKWLEEMPFWPGLDAINKASSSTIQAVKVAYSGTTQAERTQWLTDRITAIDNRVSFIKGRVNQLLNNLKDSGDPTYDALLKTFTVAVSAVPVVGQVVNYFVGQQQTAQAVQLLQVQTLIRDYTADLNQIGQIRSGLLKELQAAPSTTGTGPKNEAPNPNAVYYWLAGFALLFLLFVYLKKRNRRKR
ncbi:MULTISPECIES: hypothetical protein [unclassified Spirosoma]|uniref:hypothetical protein n=1 Tax=unclassified Spirosoma TaxID=2621999 RepID=UPI000968331B|nr:MULTISPECIES: hypothetical protein [unclassified Spirosoma]MBN8823890.1 hypothetical protein [Spirosoma sp.]OJW79718.1 MAG: hypothetical protein BGO59_00245 [Spirosoma sp. 48-14]